MLLGALAAERRAREADGRLNTGPSPIAAKSTPSSSPNAGVDSTTSAAAAELFDAGFLAPTPRTPSPPPSSAHVPTFSPITGAAAVAVEVVAANAVAPPAGPPPLDRDDFECVLCRCLLHEPLATSCGHTFCRACLARALTIAPACPMCRAPCYIDCVKGVSNFLIASCARLSAPLEASERALNAAADADALRHARLGLFFLDSASFFTYGSPVELSVFEQRYRVLVSRCLEAGAPFGLVRDATTRVGAVVRISSAVEMPDGRIALTGKVDGRFRILGDAFSLEEQGTGGLHTAVVDFFGDAPLIAGQSSTSHIEQADPNPDNNNVINNPLVKEALRDASRGLDSPTMLKLLGNVVIDAATAQLTALNNSHTSSMRTLLRRAGPPPDRNNANALCTWSHWLASAASMSRAQRAAALEATSPLTRMSLVFSSLAASARRGRGGKEGGGQVADGHGGTPAAGTGTPAERLALLLSGLTPEATFSPYPNDDHDVDDPEVVALCIKFCGQRFGKGVGLTVKWLTHFIANPAWFQFMIMLCLLSLIFADGKWGGLHR